MMDTEQRLQATISDLVKPGTGLLAADESEPTITRRFRAVGIDSSEESRRVYRSLLFTTPGLEEYVSGVILFEETLSQQSDEGVPLPQVLERKGIVPGIKVDKGKGPLVNAPGDMITFGLDGLEERLRRYQKQGARFTKWREVYPITATNPTPLGLSANAETLARYAAVCQAQGMVPIVEPEVLIDGDHSLARCAEVAQAVLDAVFQALKRHSVSLEHMILKPSMVTPGKDFARTADPQQVAEATLKVLTRTVPAAVPSINFLSGGQTPEEATANLNSINLQRRAPWPLSFSFARALQEPAMTAWKGESGNGSLMQKAFYHRARLNGMAAVGEYRPEME